MRERPGPDITRIVGILRRSGGPGGVSECTAMPVGVMPRGTRPRHARKYEPLYALALPAVNPYPVARSMLLERERASGCKRVGHLILIRCGGTQSMKH